MFQILELKVSVENIVKSVQECTEVVVKFPYGRHSKWL
jgi:hypothetical protein